MTRKNIVFHAAGLKLQTVSSLHRTRVPSQLNRARWIPEAETSDLYWWCWSLIEGVETLCIIQFSGNSDRNPVILIVVRDPGIMEPGVYIVMGLLFLDLAQSTVPGVYIEDLDGYPEQGYAVSIALGTPGQAVR